MTMKSFSLILLLAPFGLAGAFSPAALGAAKSISKTNLLVTADPPVAEETVDSVEEKELVPEASAPAATAPLAKKVEPEVKPYAYGAIWDYDRAVNPGTTMPNPARQLKPVTVAEIRAQQDVLGLWFDQVRAVHSRGLTMKNRE